MDTQTAEIAKVKEHVAARGAELSHLSAKKSGLTDELIRVKSQSAAGAPALDNPKLAASNSERPSKRAWMARQCKESSTTLSTATFFALLAEREDYKYSCESLTIENRCMPELDSNGKELLEKSAEFESVNSASKTTSKGQKNCVTAADKRSATHKMKRARAKALHSRLAEVAICSTTGASKAFTDL